MTALFDLTGHVAVVTGGNSGIGLGMADALAEHGATVSIWGTNPAKNAAALAQLQRHGGSATAHICDVGDQQAVIDTMAAVVATHGRVDSCFVNAGVPGRAASFATMPAEEWRRLMRINLDGAFYTAQEAVKQMVAQDPQGGSIVFTTSGSAFYGAQKGQHYGGSKAALNAMMKGIAVEHARHGIRCNSVLPGWVETEMTEPAFGYDKFVDNVMPRIPTRRWGQPADFAGIAVYFASRASSWHTGDIITIDGGYHSY
jgi:NAD(P)-dependent dehydrogenase (short-subunit alcohol dehydrogenase family)